VGGTSVGTASCMAGAARNAADSIKRRTAQASVPAEIIRFHISLFLVNPMLRDIRQHRMRDEVANTFALAQP
jgi:hypothetical protein